MNEEIAGFVKDFFKNVGAKVSLEGEVIKIENVPKEMNDSLGNKSEYYFTTNEKESEKAELLTKGSLILKYINDYMRSRGQTTLLKIDFSDKIENLKVPINLKECEIHSQEKKEVMEYIFRFTFLSDVYYLNNKEQIFNDIFVRGEDIIDIDLSKYNLLEGNPKETIYVESSYPYTLAKNSIKHKLKPYIDNLSKELSIKLEKEIKRINEHYEFSDGEIKEKIKKIEKNIEEYKKEKEEKKITKARKEISELNEKLNDRLKEAEKNFFLNDESNKHSISINTKLSNCTVIYYPNYKFKVHIKNKKAMRGIEIGFDPFNNKFLNVYCDSCKNVISELHMCSMGHVFCQNCTSQRCKECYLETCKSCIKKECNVCKSKLCRKCDRQCSVCFKDVCLTHAKEEKNTQKSICDSCGRNCCKCNGWFDNKKLKLFGPKKICEVCLRLNNINKK